ncbi:unnamed protein product [Didymodactylos carnosus]|uniref:Uncharacterized protein n=1 Tax=Didymodactylos carnosus TaxID=1234261 RepID=A0A8S2IKA5_9BILA|nr:unnamed protein product [Didymodactylos carnosus]CAF3738350.1 unnamed protein product [Didymodactylos carnosus]
MPGDETVMSSNPPLHVIALTFLIYLDNPIKMTPVPRYFIVELLNTTTKYLDTSQDFLLGHMGYAIGILIIDFNPYVNGTASSSSTDYSDTTCSCNTTSADDFSANTPSHLQCILGLAVVHVISAFLYWWSWRDHTWSDVIMIPEYLNHIEAGLYLWSSIWYPQESSLYDNYTLSVHKIEITAAFVELIASFGWIMSWYRTYTRTLGRGFTLDDPDTINVYPDQYGTNYLYTNGDILYFVGACYYIFACLRDDGWFWFMPFAGQYRIASGKLSGNHEPPIQTCVWKKIVFQSQKR